MVNIVIVSHSRRLAEGVVELAGQMTQGRTTFAIAAGVDDVDNPIGTDPLAIMAAIEQVNSPDGVLVLMDLGSAILSADMAREMLDAAVAGNVRLCAAPLVEGAIAAGVAAASGMTLDAVFSQAHQALQAKYQQLRQTDCLCVGSAPQQSVAADALSCHWTVRNPHGLHARPSAAIVAAMTPLDAEVTLSKADKTASAKSLNGIALLGVRQGDVVTCRASGPQAQAAIDAFQRLAQDDFGDAVRRPENGGVLNGIAVSDGRAAAPAWHYPSLPAAAPGPFAGAENELARLQQALGLAHDELEQLAAVARRKLSEQEAGIFVAQQLMLEDGDLLASVAGELARQPSPVETAWRRVVAGIAAEYRQVADPYLHERYQDVCDMGERVLACLAGQRYAPPTPPRPVILLARELYPSAAIQLDPAVIKGICLERDASTAHSLMIVRALGIPCVAGVADILRRAPNGEPVALDGATGAVWLNP